MPRNQVSLDEIKVFVEKLKDEVVRDNTCKDCADKYLNKVLDKLREYRY
jgi:hypothetical protein